MNEHILWTSMLLSNFVLSFYLLAIQASFSLLQGQNIYAHAFVISAVFYFPIKDENFKIS